MAVADVGEDLTKDLEPPVEFPFPFEPYDIQKAFMRELYIALEKGKIGIFESPTGTGKSLSLICSALKWLIDHEEHHKKKVEAVLNGSLSPSVLMESSEKNEDDKTSLSSESKTRTVPDWFMSYDKDKSRRETVEKIKTELRQKAKRKEKLKRLRENGQSGNWRAKRKHDKDSPVKAEIKELLAKGSSVGKSEGEPDDDDIVVTEYFSDDEQPGKQGDLSSDEEEEKLEEEHVRKVYYCSRTHTQLAQFVREVQQSPYHDRVQVITLGSRQSLCINEEVTRLKSLSLINDRCLEMQKNKKKGAEKQACKKGDPPKKRQRTTDRSTSCPFYKPEPIETFRDWALADIQDIEQLVTAGRGLKACPYYGVRRAIPQAQLVVLPYNILLHAHTRKAVGVKLKGNVVIIDEAHNLLDTISSVYSIEISGSHISKALSQLSQYMQRYKSRLKAKNLMYINQLLHVLGCFLKTLDSSPNKLFPTDNTALDARPSTVCKRSESSSSLKQLDKHVVVPEVKGHGYTEESGTRLMRLNDFLLSSNTDNVNFFKILKYCEKSQISKKLNGFVDRYFDPTVGTVQLNSPLMLIESFLQSLTNCDKDGRIVVTKSSHLSGSSLKFLLLNPSIHFSSIVADARAIIVAGGTMQPVSEFKDQLLASVEVKPERILEFSCGHVIPSNHLLPICLCKGPSGVEFEFTYQQRNTPALMDELGRSVVNLSNVVPGGMVCFFPSYDYEQRVHAHWDITGVLGKIGRKKRIFREPKLASQVDTVLSQYGKCIEVSNQGGRDGLTGALMLCVVGGKLSEGINFSDDLGRCVLMVGLPYPNLKSPELNEKMDYLNSTQRRNADGRLPGRVHYENLCMKAINQSIGRSIRHSRDYASIILVDNRYKRSSVQSKLPGWIASQLQVCEKFGPAYAAVRKFFVTDRS